jgi:hypothetical protein
MAVWRSVSQIRVRADGANEKCVSFVEALV